MVVRNAYHRLTSYIWHQKDVVGNFFTKYHDANADIDNFEREKDAKNKRIKEISNLLKNSDEEEIVAKENLRDSIKADIRTYEQKIARLEIELEDINRKKDIKDRELKSVKLM